MTATRTFEGRRIWRVSDNAFRSAASLIASAEQPHRPEMVIGVARGGRELACALATQLHVPALMITAKHNASDQIALPASGLVTVDASGLRQVAPRCRVLVADDICGSGATIRAVTTAITSALDPAQVRSAVLCRNAGSDLVPGTWVWDVADWVCFPWEPDPAAPTENLPEPDTVRHP